MKRRIQKGLLLFCAAALVLSAAACTDIQEHALHLTEQAKSVVTLPAEYSITYEVREPEEDAITLVTKARDSNGTIYFANGGEELLFVNRAGKYRLLEKKARGNFMETTTGKLYTEDDVETATAAFQECAEQSKIQYTSGFVQMEDSMVLERPCTVFENRIGVEQMNTTYILQVDQQTGVCLSWNEVSDTGIFTSKPSQTIFICTEFVTENVTLPVDLAAPEN